MPLTVAIVGRPNVGKSTLFNRLVGRRAAIVDDTPGVTRDRRIGEAQLGDLAFRVVDTAGFEEAPPDTLQGRMQQQTGRAVAEADVVLLVVDARSGLTPVDRDFARWLRRAGTPVILVANKAEGRQADAGLADAFELGLGEPVPVSAAHGGGMSDLLDALRPFAEPAPASVEAPPDGPAGPRAEGGDGAEAEPETEDEPDTPIRLAIVGRPNVGKSTLLNGLLGEERVLTGPEPGVTRDAIQVDWTYRDRAIQLVDTAGMRRRARVEEKLERMSVADTLNAIRLAQVVILVVEADALLERQDLTIARHVVEEGRALVVAVNKWDVVANAPAALERLRDRLETSLPQVRGVPVATVSALRRRNLDRLMDGVLRMHQVWNRRVPTGPLNRWLAGVLETHPPPMVAGRRLKLRYTTQIKARPPTFALWTTRPAEMPDSYLRYLVNSLRDTFDLPGVPIRVMLRKGKNPYDNR